MGLLFPGACPRVIADLPFACVRLCTGDVEVSERGGWGGGRLGFAVPLIGAFGD